MEGGEARFRPVLPLRSLLGPHAPYLPPKGFRESFFDGGETELEPLLKGSRWGRLLLKGWVGRLIREGYRYKEYVDSLYDDEILYTDHQVSHLLDALEDLGVMDETLIVVTSDHGEGLGENGIFYDHHALRLGHKSSINYEASGGGS